MTNHDEIPFEQTATNMVVTVQNTIDGYRMGEIRALAQEPVQNSKDAQAPGSNKVRVDFELHRRTLRDGTPATMLTITDTGTTGLGGEILTRRQIDELGGVMPLGHDWNAFEAHGYTKRHESALGSRGQGKAAMLYASRPPCPDEERPRMVIIYDTLLPSGDYRLGVRYANPSDRVRKPLLDDNAKKALRGEFFNIDRNLEFPIALEPLREPGTRVIIPFLSEPAQSAIVSGKFSRWLQMLWWRLIQRRELEIRVIQVGGTEVVEVPSWWRDEAWLREYDAKTVYAVSDIAIPHDPDLKIKRIVLRCDDDIPEYEPLIGGKEPEFDGVQLLRGGQWIETLGRPETWFTRLVPEVLKPRFRGFVEFDRLLDGELRGPMHESPQHDDFKRTTALVKSIIGQVEDAVSAFSAEAGWTAPGDDIVDTEDRDRDVARQVIATFTQPLEIPGGRRGGSGKGSTRLTVKLDADYPFRDSTRVNWGQALHNLRASCSSGPTPAIGNVELTLNIVNPDQETSPIAKATVDLDSEGAASVSFKDIQIIQGKSGSDSARAYASCTTPGRYRVQIVAKPSNAPSATTSRSVYVEEDPPSPPTKPISLEVTAKNAGDPERERINAGEELYVSIGIRNRALRAKALYVDASVNASEVPAHLAGQPDVRRSLMLLSRHRVTVDGVGQLGNPSVRITAHTAVVKLLDDLPNPPMSGLHIALQPGRHTVQVDVRDESDEIVAWAGKVIWFEEDPPNRTSGGDPFVLEARTDDFDSTSEAHPAWELRRPDDESGQLRLLYAVNHPLYLAADESDGRITRKKPATRAYLAEISAEALLSWMLTPVIEENGNESRFEHIFANRDVDGRWANLADRAETLCGMYRSLNGDSIEDALALRRVVIAYMVRLLDVRG